jgi:hypothetical protein
MKKMLAIILAAASLSAQAYDDKLVYIGEFGQGGHKFAEWLDANSVLVQNGDKYVTVVQLYKTPQTLPDGRTYTNDIIRYHVGCLDDHSMGAVAIVLALSMNGKDQLKKTVVNAELKTVTPGSAGAAIHDTICNYD